MTDAFDAYPRRAPRALVRLVGRAVAWLFVLALLIQLSWNMFAPKLFGAATLHMRETLGLALFAAIVAFGVRFVLGHTRHG